MLTGIQSLFGKKNNSKPSESDISVRSPEEIPNLEKAIKIGPVTFVLVHADWCGPCQGYKPIWKELEQSPGRQANTAMIHHDMVEKSPTLRNAKIPGYPSVLKVFSNGHIEEYKGEQNKKTNAMPNIRDKEAMLSELKVPSVANTKTKPNVSNAVANTLPKGIMPSKNIAKRVSLFVKQPVRNNTRKTNVIKQNNTGTLTYKTLNKKYPASEIARRNLTNSTISVRNTLVPSSKKNISIGPSLPPMKGGLYRALTQALMKAGPASILFAASQMLPPKKSRGSTMRLTRKSNRKTRKN
jgi:thiol-disulfide isomerase/thioredoxin